MKTAIVKLSDITTAGRMDARYHIVAQEHLARTEALKADLTNEEALARLATIPDDAKRSLRVLSRGGSAPSIPKIERDDPHLCIAILEAARDDEIAALRTRMEDAQRQIDALEMLAPR